MAGPIQLNPTEQDALVKQIGLALLRAAPADWASVEVSFRAIGRYTEVRGQVAFADESTAELPIAPEIVGLFARLRAGMYREGRGTWFNARYQLDRPAAYNLEYDRDEPRWQNPPPPPAFFDELRMFPRDEENVPEWLPRALAALQPPFRTARIFDGMGPSGPVLNRPPLEGDERDEVQRYLDAAPLALPARGYDTDHFDEERRQTVPVAFHTDGVWIWPAAVNFYLRTHGVPPDPELVAHIRRAGFRVPEVDEQARTAAAAFIAGPRRPPVRQPDMAQPEQPAAGEPAAPTFDHPERVPEDGGDDEPRHDEPDHAGFEQHGLEHHEPDHHEPDHHEPEHHGPEQREPEHGEHHEPGHAAAEPVDDEPNVPDPVSVDEPLPPVSAAAEVVAHLRARLTTLGVPESAYTVGTPSGATWAMEQTGEGWRVGWFDGHYIAPAVFNDPADAAAFLAGKLILESASAPAPESGPPTVSAPLAELEDDDDDSYDRRRPLPPSRPVQSSPSGDDLFRPTRPAGDDLFAPHQFDDDDEEYRPGRFGQFAASRPDVDEQAESRHALPQDGVSDRSGPSNAEADDQVRADDLAEDEQHAPEVQFTPPAEPPAHEQLFTHGTAPRPGEGGEYGQFVPAEHEQLFTDGAEQPFAEDEPARREQFGTPPGHHAAGADAAQQHFAEAGPDRPYRPDEPGGQDRQHFTPAAAAPLPFTPGEPGEQYGAPAQPFAPGEPTGHEQQHFSPAGAAPQSFAPGEQYATPPQPFAHDEPTGHGQQHFAEPGLQPFTPGDVAGQAGAAPQQATAGEPEGHEHHGAPAHHFAEPGAPAQPFPPGGRFAEPGAPPQPFAPGQPTGPDHFAGPGPQSFAQAEQTGHGQQFTEPGGPQPGTPGEPTGSDQQHFAAGAQPFTPPDHAGLQFAEPGAPQPFAGDPAGRDQQRFNGPGPQPFTPGEQAGHGHQRFAEPGGAQPSFGPGEPAGHEQRFQGAAGEAQQFAEQAVGPHQEAGQDGHGQPVRPAPRQDAGEPGRHGQPFAQAEPGREQPERFGEPQGQFAPRDRAQPTDQISQQAAEPPRRTEQQAGLRRPQDWPIQPLAGEPPLTLFRGKQLVQLPEGTELDRYGDPSGNLTYAVGTPFDRRSLVPDWINRPYRAYRVLRPTEALTGSAIPWFDQPGGGTAYVLPQSIAELVGNGVLEEIPDRQPPARA